MGDEAALLKKKVSICKGYREVIETRLKETDDLLAPGYVDSVKAASAAVAGLTLSEANYDEAIKIIRDRFGNQEKIIAKHMKELLHLDRSSYHNLRALYDKVECHTRELKALGVSEEAYRYLLLSLIVKKLPRDIALSISRKIPEDAWNLSSIMNELGEELRAREHTVDKTGNNDPKNREYYKRSEDRRHKENGAKRPPGPPTTTAMTSHTSSSRCCYCMGQHAFDMFSKICTPEE
uniref:Uncharacterized protein n=1 Tax=Amphimedon queenslandica TaxID=400682 RepID=A0A1X7T332_AMPQE